MNLKYVITGTGRCGTLFLSRLLTSLDIPCTHEGIFTPEGYRKAVAILKSNKIRNSLCSGGKCLINPVADASYMAAPFIDQLDSTIIHAVRDPILVINSFLEGFKYFLSGNLYGKTKEWQYEYPPGADPQFQYHKFIYTYCPELMKPMLPVLRACLYYTQWNKMIEEKSNKYFFFRIEDPIDNLIDFLNVPKKQPYNDTSANKVNYEIKYKLNDIPEGTIKRDFIEMGSRYGYFRIGM